MRYKSLKTFFNIFKFKIFNLLTFSSNPIDQISGNEKNERICLSGL